MSFEPQKWFVGLMDFFSVLLPGALLTYMLKDAAGPFILGVRYESLRATEAWAVFLVSSYLFGHIVFLLSSWLDEGYDWLRARTLNKQFRALARGGRLPNRLVRFIVWLVFKRERDLALDRAIALKKKALAPLEAQSAVNTFQWAKALITMQSPESLTTLQRFEADSKFFRCLAVVLLALELQWLAQPHHRRLAAAGAALLVLSLWRYMELRYKATNQAYWTVITLAGRDGKTTLPSAATRRDGLTHAGGVVFRQRGDGREYLLVAATDNPLERVLPKGRIEDSEEPSETAVREVREETGVWARVLNQLGRMDLPIKGGTIAVQFYVMEAVAEGRPEETDRRHFWMRLEKAVAEATYPQTRQLLEAAERLNTYVASAS
ncbi:MAG TPA: NUDIX domain-containing protein [Vicinamibacterales bacterium]|nr:NUDIX domain-containing protein [Vicinamibacterales bacterium]